MFEQIIIVSTQLQLEKQLLFVILIQNFPY